jgi:hypothetical protein
MRPSMFMGYVMVMQRFQQVRWFFAEGIHKLLHQWNACLSITNGNYLNGLYFFTQKNPQMSFI